VSVLGCVLLEGLSVNFFLCAINFYSREVVLCISSF
jgi:hypothetical protein